MEATIKKIEISFTVFLSDDQSKTQEQVIINNELLCSIVEGKILESLIGLDTNVGSIHDAVISQK